MTALRFTPVLRAAAAVGLSIGALVLQQTTHQRQIQKQTEPTASKPDFVLKFPFISPINISSIFSAKKSLENEVPNEATPAEVEFNRSSRYPVPPGWKGPIFKIRNDYPTASPVVDESALRDTMPWLGIDFRKEPEAYANAVLNYCFEGNVESDWVVQNNKVRNWFHAPWLHASPNGREALRGLTFERPTPPFEFAATQTETLQNVAIGFYNELGATAFEKIWKDPNEPNWKDHVSFPLGTATLKLMMTNATDEQVPTMRGSPGFHAVIAQQAGGTVVPRTAKVRNEFATLVRLFQVDFAVRDNQSPIVWVFGTFMYVHNHFESNPWKRLVPVGLQWGDDPSLTQKAFERGARPAETWINPFAEVIRKILGGK